MQIKPRDTAVKTLLETGYYLVPRFQRPYSWDRENVDDFWQDAIVSEDEDYFIGSFVFWADSIHQNRYFIVDGQQRITTITLLLAVLRNALLDMREQVLAEGIHNLIERPDINNIRKYVLYSDTPYPYLQEYIQKLGSPNVEIELGKEEKSLKSAFDYLTEKVSRRLESIDIDTTIADDKKSSKKLDAIKSIRDKLLRLKLIVVELDNEDDAYLVFETLNTRGKDLTVSDLVKNLLTRLLRMENQDVDLARDKWISIQKQFDAAEIDININTFILYSWISRYPYTSATKLFREIKQQINVNNANDFLDKLVFDSHIYRKLLEPNAFHWKRNEIRIRNSIRALNVFRVAQPLPMMISLLRAFESNAITSKQVGKAFSALEKFHAQFTAITSQRIGGGTARLYASSAQQLYEAPDKNGKNVIINDFLSKLRERRPSFEEYLVNFNELYFTSTETRQRGLFRYILSTLDSYLRGTKEGIDYEHYTIEHLIPEGAGDSVAVSSEKVGMIGNMVFVTQELNEQLGSKKFSEKIEILKQENVPLDDILQNAEDVTDKIIEDRTSYIAELTYYQLLNF
jgi:uncharacterized protein with ParB-like and HNH nuclease domain